MLKPTLQVALRASGAVSSPAAFWRGARPKGKQQMWQGTKQHSPASARSATDGKKLPAVASNTSVAKKLFILGTHEKLWAWVAPVKLCCHTQR